MTAPVQPDPPLAVHWLGRISYAEASERQEQLVRDRRRQVVPDTLLLLEHPPVITLGRGGDANHVVATPEMLARAGVEVVESGRGGDVTYHGPGQLVGYPIVALAPERRDAHRYLRDLEEALIRTAADFGVVAGRVEGLTGIWVGGEKLAAIGVRLNSGWITSHGFAINVTTDLDGFEAIVPCGISDRGVTSLERLRDDPPGMLDVASRIATQLADVLGRSAQSPPDGPLRLAGGTGQEVCSPSTAREGESR